MSHLLEQFFEPASGARQEDFGVRKRLEELKGYHDGFVDVLRRTFNAGAQIDKLDDLDATPPDSHYVFWLDISMKDVQFVAEGQGGQNLLDEEGEVLLGGLVGVPGGGELGTMHVLSDDVDMVRVFEVLEDLSDVWVVNFVESINIVFYPFDELGAALTLVNYLHRPFDH